MDEGTCSAAEVFLGRLKEAGVDVLLANGGTDFPSIIEAYARAPETGIAMPEPLVVPHESVAVAMAHGHWLVSGRPAAVMVHVNVGLANAAMGLVNAASDFVPLLMLSGRTPVTEGARFGARSSPIHWGQEMRDQGGMVRELVKWDYEMRYPEQAGGLVERAMAIAMSDPKGPVYLSLPREALAGQVAPTRPGPVAPARMGAADAAAVAEAAALIAGARAPVVITQGPAPRDGFEPLAGFVEVKAEIRKVDGKIGGVDDKIRRIEAEVARIDGRISQLPSTLQLLGFAIAVFIAAGVMRWISG